MDIGIMARTFIYQTDEETFQNIVNHGIHHIQFSFTCAGLNELPDKINPKLCEKIRAEMDRLGLIMSAVSGTFNMIDPDLKKRQDGLRRLRELASVCKMIGTSVITLCTGTRDPVSMWRRHPDNDLPSAWNDLVESLSQALKYAEEYKVILAFEPEVSNVIDSAIKGRKLIDEMNSEYLKVVFDPANIFHKGELPRMQEIITSAFDLLGDYIALAHAKDLDHDGDAGHLPAGKGLLDYELYLSLLNQKKPDCSVILHGLGEDQVDECVNFLRSKMPIK